MKRTIPIALFALLLTGCSVGGNASACEDATAVIVEAADVADLGAQMAGSETARTDVADRLKAGGNELRSIAEGAGAESKTVILAAGDALYSYGEATEEPDKATALHSASNKLVLALHDVSGVCD